MKAMQAQGVEWGEDYRGAARQTLAELLEGRMGQLIDEHLERMAELGQADRRNRCYTRWLRPSSATSSCRCRAPGPSARSRLCGPLPGGPRMSIA
jgi:hypothetical protein